MSDPNTFLYLLFIAFLGAFALQLVRWSVPKCPVCRKRKHVQLSVYPQATYCRCRQCDYSWVKGR